MANGVANWANIIANRAKHPRKRADTQVCPYNTPENRQNPANPLTNPGKYFYIYLKCNPRPASHASR